MADKPLLKALKEIKREKDEAEAIDISSMDADDLLDIAGCLGGESKNALKLICEAVKEMRGSVNCSRILEEQLPTNEELDALTEEG